MPRTNTSSQDINNKQTSSEAFPSNQDSKESNNVVSAPSISLPKGGGAIKGMGEKFAANPVTGTASFSIPIYTSPGRSGFGPQLSLSYDSGSGNGPFGFGWSLSLPSITRKTDKGLPKYQDPLESDVFILSGSEDLVSLLNPDGSRFKDQTTSSDYVIYRYRPRIEGLFARIERWTRKSDGETHWRSISKDNILTVYGRDERSRISDPTDASRVFSWLICESYDDKGNAIVYEYASENDKGGGIDLAQANERNRSRTANRCIKRIWYGNRQPLLIDVNKPSFRRSHLEVEQSELSLSFAGWMFEVVFDYGGEDHYITLPLDSTLSEADQHQFVQASANPSVGNGDDDENDEGNNIVWSSTRPDPFSTYRAGFEVRTYRRCQRVLMFHRFPELGTEPYLVRSTEFDYSDFDYSKVDEKQLQAIDVKAELAHKGSTRFASFIQSITQSGYVQDETKPSTAINGVEFLTYFKKSIPPLEFEYSLAYIDEDVKEVDPVSLENLPAGLDGTRYQWIDLDGEGLSGILTEQDGAWFYKRNISALTIKGDDGKHVNAAQFAPVEKLKDVPSPGNFRSSSQQLMDLSGDGQLDLVDFNVPLAGFFERTADEKWETFVPFTSLPNIHWDDPNLKVMDLTGDGHADILITEDNAFVWYPSLAEKGFAAEGARKVIQSLDEEKGPQLVFADTTQSIYLADMSGDGLTDLVRLRNGEVCYWPNLGYGRFGAKVTMDNAPLFDSPDQFNQRYIRLADVDGSGVTDIIYLGRNGVQIYFNQSGNRWSAGYTISNFPHIDDLSSIQITDLLGKGTACIIWSSSLPADSNRPMRYIDLMGQGKPHLLINEKNNLGAETRIHYAASTKFYLADKYAGKPWITKLPFPVQVVERVETYDHVSRNHFLTRYAYHHGYFDGAEREFCGFGMVEQWDTEQFAALSNSNDFPAADNIDAASHVPPVLTKTWSHTGIYLGRDHVSDFFAGFVDGDNQGEYYREPALQEDPEEARRQLLQDTTLPSGLTIEEERQAARALKGRMLRQEVYGLDGSEKEQHPYSVLEENFALKMLQPCGENLYAVFLVHEHEAITYHYEHNPSDPRISHELMLEVDDYGNVSKQAAIGYGRRQPDMSLPLQEDRDKQTHSLVIYTENRVTTAVNDSDCHRAPMSCETSTFELTGYSPTGPAGRFHHLDFVQPDPNPTNNSFSHIFDEEISYEDEPASSGMRQRRLIEQVRTIYRKNELTDLLPLGELESLALPGESYKLAFTPGLLLKVYQRPPLAEGQPPENLLPDPLNVLGGQGADRGGYMQSQELKALGYFPESDPDDHWWVPSGRILFSPGSSDTAAQELEYASQHFFLAHRYRDPFHTDTASTEHFFTFDSYDLLILETRDALQNRITVGERDEDGNLTMQGNDYRVLQPRFVTDPNRNRTAVAFDALGMLVGTAVMGKPAPSAEAEGDSLDGFQADLTEEVILDHISNPLNIPPHAILQRATTRMVYDLFAYYRTKEQEDEGDGPHPPVVYSITRDTHEADLQEGTPTKVQRSFSYSDGFGREIQKKIQAEPGPLNLNDPNSPIVDPRWVGSGWTIYNNKGKPVRKYEPFFSPIPSFEFRHIVGVSQVLFYDPVGRVVATLHPNRSYEKVVFDPWQQKIWDVNDTVLLSPDSDEDVKGFFLQDDGTSRLPVDLYLPTWRDLRMDPAFDTEANERWPNIRIRNAEKQAAEKTEVHANTPATAYFDSLGRTFLTVSHNKGMDERVDPPETFEEKYSTRINLDIEGNQREVKDAKDRIVERNDYDILGNRIKQESMDAGKRLLLNDVVGNPFYRWNSRGHTISTSYDELRRPLDVRLQSSEPAVNKRVELYIYGESEGHEHNHRGKVFRHFDEAGLVTNVKYDFKGNLLESNRRLAINYKETPDWSSSDPEMSELEDETFSSSTAYDALNRPIRLITHDDSTTHYFYNEAGLLERVEVNLRGATVSTAMVRDIDYNAKGQRVLIEYGNGVVTRYTYDDETFRLIHMVTLRGNEHLQDLSNSCDPIGNITHIQDDADIHNTIFFLNHRVEPSADYTYDAIYRLINASGREHLGLVNGVLQPPAPTNHTDEPRVNLPHPNDGNAMGRYLEIYVYDSVGNILDITHRSSQPSNPSWSRSYQHLEPSFIQPDLHNNNQLSNTTVGDIQELFHYDKHGNMDSMPHLHLMEYDFRDNLSATSRQIVNNGGTPEITYYVYDDTGQRVRKVTELQAIEGELPRRKDERIYAGNFEIYRRYGGDGIDIALERETLHASDGNNQRIAIIDTRTRGDDDCPQQSMRYQFTNHLGSSSLELDKEANIVNYEEYYPYGSTSYQGQRDMCELSSRRFRYVGKERDEETSFYYIGSRYYMPWLGRWSSIDPAGLIDGTAAYNYSRNNPTTLRDPSGLRAVSSAGEVQNRPHPKVLVSGSNPPSGAESTEDLQNALLKTQGMFFIGDPIYDQENQIWLIHPSQIIDTISPGDYNFEEEELIIGEAPRNETLDNIQTALDLGGMIPGFGEAFDIINAGISLARGDYDTAALNAAAALPFLGNAITGSKLAAKTTSAIKKSGKIDEAQITGKAQKTGTPGHGAPPSGSGGDATIGGGPITREDRLRQLADDPNTSRADKGWIKNQIRRKEREQQGHIRNPPGKDLRHPPGRATAQGYDYSETQLWDRATHQEIEHRFLRERSTGTTINLNPKKPRKPPLPLP